MKRIFSIIMEYGLGLPTGTIAFWGTLVLRILTVDYTFKTRHRTLSVSLRSTGKNGSKAFQLNDIKSWNKQRN